jgi:diacylglycerol kinase family enzyme
MTGAEIMDIQVDGEIIEGTKRIEVTMIPGCLDVFSN